MPNSLSYNLTALFRSGHCTVDTFAKMADVSVHMVRWGWRAENAKIPPEERLKIGKVVSMYLRRYPEVFVVPMRPALNRTPNEHELPGRGVYEDPPTFPGTRTYTVWNENRDCIVQVTWPVSRATAERVEGLWRLLDKEFPELAATPLRAI